MRVYLFLKVIYLGLRVESFRPLNINAIFFLNAIMLLSYLFLIILFLVTLAYNRNFPPSLRIYSTRPFSRHLICSITFTAASLSLLFKALRL